MACLDDNPDVKNRMQVLLEQREAQSLVSCSRVHKGVIQFLKCLQVSSSVVRAEEQGGGNDQQKDSEGSLSSTRP